MSFVYSKPTIYSKLLQQSHWLNSWHSLSWLSTMAQEHVVDSLCVELYMNIEIASICISCKPCKNVFFFLGLEIHLTKTYGLIIK